MANSWLDERVKGDLVRQWIEHKTVPLHRHTIWYYFGGMTLFLFAIQAMTGILLLLYYRPTADAAFESVQFIMTEVRFGWLVRSIHSWAANLLILVLFIHMASVYFTKAYRRPRELTWFSGVALLIIALGFGFSGYLLPWNKLAFFATQVGTQIAGVTPLVGDFLLKFLRGGDEVTGATLTRFFGFHVAVLPAMITALLGIHVMLVQFHGMSAPPEHPPERVMPFFPNFLLRDAVGWLVALGALAALSAIFPWELGEKADPFAPAPEGIRPEWFFVWMFETLKLFPAHILIFEGEQVALFGFGLLLLLLVGVPFLDRDGASPMRSRIFSILGWLLLFYVIVTTIRGYGITTAMAAAPDQDIHVQRGVACADCHPDDPSGKGRPIKAAEIADICGRCHSDLNYMRKFNPQMRVDQVIEYRLSVHGMRNAKGDTGVATCVSCHTAHEILPVRNTNAPVYPTRVASTCAKCHEDEFQAYRASIHSEYMDEKRDLSAPTCNDCHGNHGARPPGLDSVPAVCGQCHVQEMNHFESSPHREPFHDMGLSGCVACHDNHQIHDADDRMLGTTEQAICSTCHSEGDAAFPKIRIMQARILGLRLAIDRASEVLGRAERAGVEVSRAKFDLFEAGNQLVKARVTIHSFTPEKVDELVSAGMTIAVDADRAGHDALAEVDFRRKGLGYSLIGIAILIVALLFKIRQIDARRPDSH